MSLPLAKQQAVSDLADALYPMLPGSTWGHGNKGLTSPGAATRAGLAGFYPGGSKRPAIVAMAFAPVVRLFRGRV
jgi:hypothetical protein